MTAPVSRLLVALAARSLGAERRDWGLAMTAEFESAVDDDHALSFAFGCLLGAWREMPGHEEGRFALASHLVAIGFLVPVAALLVWQTLTGATVSGNAFINSGNLAALPALAVVSLLLALGHLRLGWVMLDRDWERVTRTATLNAALSTTLVTVTGAMFLCEPRFLVHAAITGAELVAVLTLARWHDALPPHATRLSSA